MRVPILARTPTLISDSRIFPATITLQAINLIPVHFSRSATELQQRDAGGNILGGSILRQEAGLVTLPNYAGQLYARANADTEIELTSTPIAELLPSLRGAKSLLDRALNFFGLALLLLLTVPAQAQDIQLYPAGEATVITLDRPWRNFNQTYVFTPRSTASTIFLYITNNNPTNIHTLTMTIRRSGIPNLRDFSNNAADWEIAPLTGNCSPIAVVTTVTCHAAAASAARIAITITAAGALAGTPDTGNILLIQTRSAPRGSTITGAIDDGASDGEATAQLGQVVNARNYIFDFGTSAWNRAHNARGEGDNSGGSGIITTSLNLFDGSSYDRMRGSAETGLDVSPPIAGDSQRDATAYFANNNITNPGAILDLLSVVATGTRSVYFDRMILHCDANCNFNLTTVINNGAGCIDEAEVNLKIANATAAQAEAISACATDPNPGNTLMEVSLGARDTLVLDLRGLIGIANSQDGIMIQVASGTFSARATIFWYEQ